MDDPAKKALQNEIRDQTVRQRSKVIDTLVEVITSESEDAVLPYLRTILNNQKKLSIVLQEIYLDGTITNDVTMSGLL